MHLAYRIAKFDIFSDLFIHLVQYDREPLYYIPHNTTEWEKITRFVEYL
jgi:hypothetical protein